jgi:hypothetical protein
MWPQEKAKDHRQFRGPGRRIEDRAGTPYSVNADTHDAQISVCHIPSLVMIFAMGQTSLAAKFRIEF